MSEVYDLGDPERKLDREQSMADLELLKELELDQVQGSLFAGDVSAPPVAPHAERLP